MCIYRTKKSTLFWPFSTLCANANIRRLVLVISRHARLNRLEYSLLAAVPYSLCFTYNLSTVVEVHLNLNSKQKHIIPHLTKGNIFLT